MWFSVPSSVSVTPASGLKVPPGPSMLNVRELVNELLAASVPCESTSGTEASPSASSDATLSVAEPVTVVPPAWLFVPPSVSVPPPVTVTEPAPVIGPA